MTYDDFIKNYPTIHTALKAVAQATASLSAPAGVLEIAMLRASQLNGCSFCVHFHLGRLRELKVPQDKLDLVAVWHEVHAFTAQERAALELAETLTLLTSQLQRKEAMTAAKGRFSESELLALVLAIASVNSWNRVSMGLGFPVP